MCIPALRDDVKYTLVHGHQHLQTPPPSLQRTVLRVELAWPSRYDIALHRSRCVGRKTVNESQSCGDIRLAQLRPCRAGDLRCLLQQGD